MVGYNAGHLLCTRQTKPAIDMLNDVLLRLTVDQLKPLMRWLPDTTPTGKKDQLIGQILKSLDGAGPFPVLRGRSLQLAIRHR